MRDKQHSIHYSHTKNPQEQTKPRNRNRAYPQTALSRHGGLFDKLPTCQKKLQQITYLTLIAVISYTAYRILGEIASGIGGFIETDLASGIYGLRSLLLAEALYVLQVLVGFAVYQKYLSEKFSLLWFSVALLVGMLGPSLVGIVLTLLIQDSVTLGQITVDRLEYLRLTGMGYLFVLVPTLIATLVSILWIRYKIRRQ